MDVDIDGLTLTLGGRPVLDGVSLHAQPGEIYGLLGPNGAGKSTTLSVITGLRRAASGQVSVLGHDPAREALALHREIGVLPERSGFYDWMDAPDYLAWFAQLYGRRLTGPEITAELAQVGLVGRNRRAIGTYSQGMRQRLGLARALLHRPRLLILDEPTNGLDPRGRREVHNLLLERSRQNGVGILLCTHLLDDVERLCTRIGILHQGRTVFEGALSELAQVGLVGRNRRAIGTYSQGMRQRLGLARALLHRPRLLILDEPTNGLDPRGRREVHDLLLERSRQDGVGILLCTHLLDDVERLCTRIGILHQGRTVFEGALSELATASNEGESYRLHLRTEPPAVPLPPGVELLGWRGEWARIKLDGTRPPEDVWRGLLAARWPIAEIHQEAGGLETLYLRMTQKEEGPA